MRSGENVEQEGRRDQCHRPSETAPRCLEQQNRADDRHHDVLRRWRAGTPEPKLTERARGLLKGEAPRTGAVSVSDGVGMSGTLTDEGLDVTVLPLPSRAVAEAVLSNRSVVDASAAVIVAGVTSSGVR